MKKNNKSKKKRKQEVKAKSTIQELQQSRNGGQIALRGYSFQFLYSCHLMLSALNDNTTLCLEGIEDIDQIECIEDKTNITNIQLKYSNQRQDASFMYDVLKNFLEAYLLDKNRSFKLVYDFSVANGNLSKLIDNKLDKASTDYWRSTIDKIKKGMPVWNWEIYDFNDFMSKLTFEKIEKSALETKIENDLIQNYGIVSDNISIFTNGIKMFCFDSMQNRSVVGYSDIQQLIENIKFDISKGPSNPAYSWITKINFDKHQAGTSDLSFYEGKKATPLDIARGTAVARPILEKEVMDSIEKNTVTVIKSSSGQGKTTLALKVAFLLQSNYTPYQLSCCNDIKEVGNIIQYFKVRTRLGEKPLIVLDNLDAHLSQWDKLVQIMQSNVSYNYKILITTREEDWYNFSGDISSIRSLNIIKPVLSEEEAKEIFTAFKLSGKVHSKILNWQSAWSKIADKQLLIEYIYLITHGEMLSERIFSQMKEIGNSSSGNVKFEILRKVCFADICGVKLNIYKLLSGLQEKSGCDSGELLKSMMDEFLVNVTMEGNYVEGLHPIRSQHIVERLHEYLPLENTAVDVMKIADKKDFSILFSHFPEFSFDKNKFYFDVVEFCGIELDLSQYVLALQGTFSGCVIQYFKQHKEMFDDANRHGGLFLIATELCPFAKFEELEEEMSTLEKILEIQPDNLNIKYLINLRDNTPRIDILQTDIYILCKELYRIFRNIKISDICDVDSYSIIVDWLYNIDHSFDLSHNLELESIWSNVENYSIETLSSLMYTKFCADKISYLKFVDSNKDCIFDYIMKNTRSHRVYETDNTNNIHVEYILRASNVREGNNESVSRLTNICKMLPIYEYYCSDSIKPEIDILSSYKVPDDAHKEMPKRNLVITFHQNFNSLWIKTIQSNYEFDSIYEWLEHWFLARSLICDCFDKSCLFIYKLLQNKSARNLGQEIDIIRGKYNELLTGECSYPRENRPFGEIGEPPKNFSNIKSDYFNSIQNCFMQLAGLIKRDKDAIRLFFYNFRVAKSCHSKMQSMFGDLDVGKYYVKKHQELCARENQSMSDMYMCCRYYVNNQPNTHFNKYLVKTWYMSENKERLDSTKSLFEDCEEEYEIKFPTKVYYDGALSYYPIIVKNVDLTDEIEIRKLILDTISFSNSDYDYLVILFADSDNQVMPQALQINKRTFETLHKCLETEDETILESLTPPYPVEITDQTCLCFDESISIKEKDENPVLSYIGDIGEELWVYSKTKQILSSDKDENYLRQCLDEVKANIEKMLKEIEGNLPEHIVFSIKELTENVFNGMEFGDKEFNDFINKCTKIKV